MNVALFRAFPDPYRLSMTRYADDLERRVRDYMKSGESIRSEGMPGPRLDGGWRRYWDQYVRYGPYAHSRAGDVNHIVDHGYGHLTRQLPRGRTVVTFHDAVVLKLPDVSWRTRASLRHSLRATREAAAIVCDSETARRDLLEFIDVPESRVSVIPLGVDEAFRPPPDREALRKRLGFRGNTVLMVGHTQPYMNVEGMLRVVATVIARHGIDLTLVKIGTPFTPEQMRLVVELELGDRIDIVGRVAEQDLPSYFQAADALLYAPLFAGFGLPPLEAMACGTPVVASSRGAIPEVAGDAALLADAADDDALATALADVLSNPVRRRRLIDAGFERAGRFEWSRAARQMLELYRRVHRA
jgi:glycosyltransferase involved in cell wall biosynthesis